MTKYVPIGKTGEYTARFWARVAVLGLVLTGIVFASGCTTAPEVPHEQNVAGDVADINDIPQNLAIFAREAGGSILLRSEQAAAQNMQEYRRRFFAPWQEKKLPRNVLREFEAVLNWSSGKRGYAENMRQWTDAAWEDMRRNAAMDTVSGKGQAAIVTHATDLRLAPTVRPRFARIEGAGQGWPFDDFQQSSLHVGMPLMVYHRSLDGAWLLVHSPIAWGWVDAASVAFVDEAFRQTWQQTPLCAVVKEDVPLKNGEAFLAVVNVGTVLPMEGTSMVLTPVRNTSAMAEVLRVPVSAGDILSMPQPLAAQAVAGIGNRMLGKNYGWGGMYGNRDCSAMMRDLFAAFGIWLPRNSAAQAKAGEFHSLEGMTAQEKEKVLLRSAEPFRTLLCFPGHIGLYVGEFRGEPLFFHSVWGVRSRLRDGREGRIILGRAVITGVKPGAERSDVAPEGLLIERMRGYTVIGG